METVDTLRVVCTHLKESAREAEVASLRRRLNRAHVENCRLRKKAQRLDRELIAEQLAKRILQGACIGLIRQMDSLRLLAEAARE